MSNDGDSQIGSRFDWLFDDADVASELEQAPGPALNSEIRQEAMSGSTALVDATAALARLDERLLLSSEEVRVGWLARMVIVEAAASARLEGWIVDAERLGLLVRGAAAGAPDTHETQALHLLELLHRTLRRSPRQMFTPRRLATLARVRAANGASRDATWLQLLPDRGPGAGAALEEFFSGFVLPPRHKTPALLSTASMLARWHNGTAGMVLGGATGRAVAMAALARLGLCHRPLPCLAVGFLGHARTYRASAPQWPEYFAAGVGRAAVYGLVLAGSLAQRRLDLLAVLNGRRHDRHLPRVVSALIGSAGVTTRSLAVESGITPRSALMLLGDLLERGLVRDVTARHSFRVFELTGLP